MKPKNPLIKLLAVKLYCEGVMEDHPVAKDWMTDIINLVGVIDESVEGRTFLGSGLHSVDE